MLVGGHFSILSLSAARSLHCGLSLASPEQGSLDAPPCGGVSGGAVCLAATLVISAPQLGLSVSVEVNVTSGASSVAVKEYVRPRNQFALPLGVLLVKAPAGLMSPATDTVYARLALLDDTQASGLSSQLRVTVAFARTPRSRVLIEIPLPLQPSVTAWKPCGCAARVAEATPPGVVQPSAPAVKVLSAGTVGEEKVPFTTTAGSVSSAPAGAGAARAIAALRVTTRSLARCLRGTVSPTEVGGIIGQLRSTILVDHRAPAAHASTVGHGPQPLTGR